MHEGPDMSTVHHRKSFCFHSMKVSTEIGNWQSYNYYANHFQTLPKVDWTHAKGIVYLKELNGVWCHSISWSLERDTCILLSLCNPLGEGCGLPMHQIQQKPGPCLDQILWPQASRQSCVVKRQQSLMGKLGICKNCLVKMTWHSYSHFPRKEGEGNANCVKSLSFPSCMNTVVFTSQHSLFPFIFFFSRLKTTILCRYILQPVTVECICTVLFHCL